MKQSRKSFEQQNLQAVNEYKRFCDLYGPGSDETLAHAKNLLKLGATEKYLDYWSANSGSNTEE